MRTESAMTTITRAVTVAAGVFAPGHLGELTQYLPFELVDDVLAQTKTVQRRLRDLPSWGFQDSATVLDLCFYAARSYSLMRPPRTGRRWIRSWERSAER